MTVGGEPAVVGRLAELAACDEALETVAGGRTVGLMFVGDAGMGKSRLLAELGRRADARGMLVLSGSASEFERDLPFWLFVDALDEYLRGLPSSRLAALDEDVRAELPHVLPSWPAAEDPAGAGEDRRYRTHHAVRRLLEVLAAGPPLVLLLDDLHWADSGSIELLCALLRRPPVAPVVLGLALRPRQLSETLFVGVNRAVADGVLTRIELAGLTLGESRQLLAPDVDEGRVPALHAESAGNPFYLRQLALFRGPTDAVDAADQPPDAILPAAVSNALRAELALIDAATRGALEGAAVAGDPFVLDLAAVAAAVPEQAMSEALDELQLRDVVRPTTIPRRFQFRHPLLRRAIYESAPAAWRLGAHERCAESLAKRGVPVAARAHHVIASAREGDTAAVALLHDAGRAVATRAPAEAARWFSAALDLQPEPALALELWRALADALGAAGMLADARAAAARALEMVPAEADDVRVRLVATVAGLDQTLGHHDDAHRRLVAALDSLPRLDGAEAVLLMGALALDRIFRTEFDEAHEWSRRAHAAALGNRLLRVESATALARGAAFAGATLDAATAADEAAALVDALADEGLVDSTDPVIVRLAGAEMFIDRYADAARHAERGLAAVLTGGSGHHLPILFWTGLVRTALGRLPEATALLDDAVEAARSANSQSVLGRVLFARSLAATDCGDTDAALATATESVAVLDGFFGTLPSAWAGLALGAALLPVGDPVAAEQVLTIAGGSDLTRLPHPLRPGAFELLTRCRLATGHMPEAAAAAAAAATQATESGLPTALAAAGRAAAAVALHRGDPSAAADEALAAADAAESVGATIEAATARELAGQSLAEAGEVERGVHELQQAVAAFERCGAPRRAAAIERRLAGLGHRRRHRRTRPGTGATDLASLTGREREVAHLIADGKTNAEIAAALFLSVKTIETHIRNIFHKLTVSSRVQVARAVERSTPGDL